jgi:hypothetical protein
MIGLLLDRLRVRARALFRASRVEQDLHDELRGHLDRQVEELTARGMPVERRGSKRCGHSVASP